MQTEQPASAGPVERPVRPHAIRLASQLQSAAYNHGYEDAHPSNATTRQDKADAKVRETLAALYAEIDRMHTALRIAREGYASEAATGLPVLPQWRERTVALIDAALGA